MSRRAPWILAALLIGGCGKAPDPPTGPPLDALALVFPAPTQEVFDLITVDKLKKHVEALSADDMEGRAGCSKGELKAAEYVWGEMVRIGLMPSGAYDISGQMGYWQTFGAGENRYSRSCLGLFPGADPTVRDQLIIICAHHDGIGKQGATRGAAVGGAQGSDTIWNGADDNASGVAAVLAMAEAFAVGRVRTRRSVLFLTLGNQEEGNDKSGVAFYTAHSITPREKHVLIVNLDMIGRNPDRPLEVEGVRSAVGDDLANAVKKAMDANKVSFKPHDYAGEMLFRGDGSSFLKNKIPTLHVWSYWHPDYHRVSDTADKLSYDRMAAVTKALTALVCDVANSATALSWNPAMPPVDAASDDRPRLGVALEDITGDALKALNLPSGQGAVRVAAIIPSSVGAVAGLKQGDVIVSFDGKPFAALEALRVLIGAVEMEREYALDVRRGGKVERVAAVWHKSR